MAVEQTFVGQLDGRQKGRRARENTFPPLFSDLGFSMWTRRGSRKKKEKREKEIGEDCRWWSSVIRLSIPFVMRFFSLFVLGNRRRLVSGAAVPFRLSDVARRHGSLSAYPRRPIC